MCCNSRQTRFGMSSALLAVAFWGSVINRNKDVLILQITDVMCLSRICSVSLAPKLPLTAFLYINTVDFNLEFSVTMCYSAKSFVSWCLENSIFMVSRVYPAQSATAFYESISLIFGKIANIDIVFLYRALNLYYN